MRFYERHPDDPEWLVRAAEFHGHLGPWIVVGAMIGSDAVKRLATRGHWEIDVVCWMPPARQRQPFSCILDGLQAATGATLGKQNIRFDYDPLVVEGDQPVVYVRRLDQAGRAGTCLVYRLKDDLIRLLAALQPDRLEEAARLIASMPSDRMLEVATLPPEH